MRSQLAANGREYVYWGAGKTPDYEREREKEHRYHSQSTCRSTGGQALEEVQQEVDIYE